MSSSKVFSNSPYFQPKKILPRNDPNNTGWEENQPLGNADISGYQAESLVREYVEEHNDSDKLDRPNEVDEFDDINLKHSDGLSDSLIDEQIDAEDQIHPPPPPSEEPQVKNQEEIALQLEEAFNNGVAEGIRQVKVDYKTGTEALLSIAEELNITREKIFQNSMGEMQDLVLTIAEKIIRHSITAQDDTIVATVEDAIQKAIKSDEFYVCVNQEDYDIIQEKSPEIISKISGLENIVLKIDNSIEPGGCKVESDYCIVDSTIATQFQIISEKIKSRR